MYFRVISVQSRYKQSAYNNRNSQIIISIKHFNKARLKTHKDATSSYT